MSYNKYKTRNSGRFNKPGNFISTGEVGGASSRSAPTRLGCQLPGSVGGAGQRSNNTMLSRADLASTNYGAHANAAQEQYGGADQSTGDAQGQYFGGSVQPPLLPPSSADDMLKSDDVEMKVEANVEEDAGGAGQDSRPRWMKGRLVGGKKLSNKERRRRQNGFVRRLLTPKSAVMALNEMLQYEQSTPQFRVEPVGGEANHKLGTPTTYFAELTLHGNCFKGYGDNKIAARNGAAEQALRNLVIHRMNKAIHSDGSMSEGGNGEDETVPMIQLASFALHKLFGEWENQGYKVPSLRPQLVRSTEGLDNSSEASFNQRSMKRGAVEGEDSTRPPAAKKPRLLPLNAASMHPCTLLMYMRPQLECRELAAEGDRPQNMVFTYGVDVDGTTYIGKASKKKEARRKAAYAACQEVFGVKFEENPVATIAELPTQ